MRFERKYRIEGVSLAQVRQVVDAHPLGFRTHYPDRQVNNIYLDTPDLEYFRLNLIGTGERRKYRIRWYGKDPLTARSPLLEIKIKHNELGEKQIFTLSDQTSLDQASVDTWIHQEVRNHGALIPVLLNRYDRSYLISYDGKYRLTLDRTMRFASMEYPAGGNPATLPELVDEAVVMEIKYDLAHDQEFKRISWHFPFRVGKNSKYVNGVLMTGMI